MTRQNSATGKWVGALVGVAVVALAAWWYFASAPGQSSLAPGAAATPASPTPPPIQHPIADAQADLAPALQAADTPLPALDASDAVAGGEFAAVPGAQSLAELLIARALIPHIVATVDALPRRSIGDSILPLHTPAGRFKVVTDGDRLVIDADNAKRYEPYMRVARAVDPRTMVALYVRWYPLFQQAYRELGYPHGYFNDRLMTAIDDLLAAPNARPLVAVVATGDGRYTLADPTWESLSAGQKLMLRLGPENERLLKIRLNRMRVLLLGKAPTQPAHAAAKP